MTTEIAVSIRDLTVAYDSKPALWDIDVDIVAHQITAIIGPNGAGKSTLLKSILGILPISAGTIKIFGKPISESRGKIAYVPQRTAVDWDFPTHVLDVVLMGTYHQLGWFRRPGKAEKELAKHCLELVGMADFSGRQISQLSGGQQQRVFLARALAQQADLYFMDEPFAGIDAPTEEAIAKLLSQLRDEGKTLLVVHHDLESAKDYFDRAALLRVKLIAEGPVETVLNRETLAKAYGQVKSVVAAASL